MAQNKLENQIKEKLNSREIQPSAQAWDRLDAMLTVAEEKKTKRSFFSYQFIGIAASVLVLLTLGLFFFNQKNTIIEQDSVVNTEIEKENKNTEETTPSIENPVLIKEKTNEAVVSTEKIKNKKIKLETQNSQVKENTEEVSIIHQKQEEVIVNHGVVLPKKEEKTIKTTYINADDLLASVEKKTKTNIKLTKSNVKVDANYLLTEVDKDVDQTFREKVIQGFNKNYKSLKEAVVNRNNE
jgi:hypothetical protein